MMLLSANQNAYIFRANDKLDYSFNSNLAMYGLCKDGINKIL